MADSAFGLTNIYIDLTTATARVIRDALKDQWVLLSGVRINGTAGAGDGTIVLRQESATGPIVMRANVGTSQPVDGSFDIPSKPFKGLYMDAIAVAWAANAHMIIYTL